ncbi:VOC family protein [Roseomonas sp. BN140053]|uniref:VOC family protein n=1 Tax=Roseomonas sp. BN140053 TaxID=3391898 RepID=UPI0039E89C6A
MTAALDHLVVGCATLEQGERWAREVLGVAAAGGGAHPGWGTHNRLVGMGPELYLELIAPDPAQAPAPPRSFGLGSPAVREAIRDTPALLTFVARTAGLVALTEQLGGAAGEALAMSRGELHWRFAAPPDPMGGLLPCLIEWPGGVSAATRLPDSGLRLRDLVAEHPDPAGLDQALAARGVGGIAVRPGPAPVLRATLLRPDGRVVVLATG